MATRLRDRYKRAFFTGLGTLLPTVLTIFVITFCYNFITDRVARPLISFIRAQLKTTPAKDWYWKILWNKESWRLDDATFPDGSAEPLDTVPFSRLVEQHTPEWIGFVIALAVVFAVGFVFKGYLGRQIVRSLERWIQRLPVIKVIYPYAKQVTEFFFQEKKAVEPHSTVAIEYPRKGLWSLGFVTSEGFHDVQEAAGEEIVAIFIPSSPTPVTGYTILVPKSSTIPLNLTADEALRFTISGGVILPPSQLPPLALKTRKLERPESPEKGKETPGS
ncbi:MAG: DUF502 domain-containing protein [Planctomycetota bacterium]